MLQSVKSPRKPRSTSMGFCVALWGALLALGSAGFVWFASAWFVQCAVLEPASQRDPAPFLIVEMVAFVVVFLILGMFAIHRMTSTVAHELQRLDALHRAAEDARLLRQAIRARRVSR